MANARSFLLLDVATGAPLTGASPTFVDYRDKTGASRTPPANPVHVGEGVYTYQPSGSDETVGTIALVDGGASAAPRRFVHAIHTDDGSNQFFAFHIENPDGTLWAGVAPTVGSYRDKAGASRTPPALPVAAGAYLYSLTPTAGDVAADVSVRIDLPVAASGVYLDGDTSPVVSGGGGSTPVVTPSAGLAPEQLAAQALVEYLRQYLPLKVTELNTLRAAVLKTPGSGTGSASGWTISSGMTLRVSSVSSADVGTTVTLPTGAAVTAAAIATAINLASPPGLSASSDSTGRLLLSATAVPFGTTSSIVYLLPDSTGANAALGWSPGGEHIVMAPLRPPQYRGVMNGRPVGAPDAGIGFWVILGDRTTKPCPSAGMNIRRNEYDVTFEVDVLKPEMTGTPHRSREGIESALRAMREVLCTTAGYQLNRGTAGDIIRVDILDEKIDGHAFSFTDSASPNVMFDLARMVINVRVYQQSKNP